MEKHSTKNAVFICGPTAVGKTAVAIDLAQWLNTAVISFDSRQFYRELKIGAAPPTEEELRSVHHYFVGHLSLNEDFSAGAFEEEALRLLDELFQKHDTVILVGGSGLYMQALAEGFDHMPDVDSSLREELNREYRENGLEALQAELQKKDPAYYEEMDRNNPQRLIRALEVIRSTGKAYSHFRRGEKAKRNFRIIKLGLNMPREQLYERINKRVDTMIRAGLEDEVKSLLPYRHKNAMQTVGYREFIRYFDGELSLEETIEEIKKNSRRYAKRQLTWFRRDEEIEWFEPGELAGIKRYIKGHSEKL